MKTVVTHLGTLLLKKFNFTLFSFLVADSALTIIATRPVVPARDFEISKKFYSELGFRPQTLAERLVEMHFGGYAFILQDYYVEEWANNFVMHISVADLDQWWKHICGLDLPSRYKRQGRSPETREVRNSRGV